MNVATILQQLKTELDANPDLASFDKGLLGRVNRALQEVSALQSWLYLEAEATITVYPTVSGITGQTVTMTSGRYQVTTSGVTCKSYWAGQTFVGPDSVEYNIAAVDTASNYIYLATPYAGSTVSGSTSWSIKFYRYALPADCRELLSIVDRTRRMPKIYKISRPTEETYNLWPTDTGTVSVAIDEFQVTDQPPDGTPTATLSAGGSLTASNTYEYGYTFLVGGRESPMSMTVQVKTTSANKTVTIGNIQDSRDPTGPYTTGILKRLYRRDVTGGGRWLPVTSAIADSTTSYTDDGTVKVANAESKAYLGSEPYQQYVRFYPTPGESYDLKVRYVKRVRDLVADSDVPPMPTEYHQSYLIYRPMADICMQHGMTQQSAVYEARAKKILEHMEQTQLARTTDGFQKRAMRMGPPGFPIRISPWFGPTRNI